MHFCSCVRWNQQRHFDNRLGLKVTKLFQFHLCLGATLERLSLVVHWPVLWQAVTFNLDCWRCSLPWSLPQAARDESLDKHSRSSIMLITLTVDGWCVFCQFVLVSQTLNKNKNHKHSRSSQALNKNKNHKHSRSGKNMHVKACPQTVDGQCALPVGHWTLVQFQSSLPGWQ
jgi:hypothetical protein